MTGLLAHNYSLPNSEVLFAKLNGGIISPQVRPLRGMSSNSVRGKLHASTINQQLYKFKQLPFGAKVPPTVLQQMLSDCDFTIAYLNDILIKCESLVQHGVFERIIQVKTDRIKMWIFDGKGQICRSSNQKWTPARPIKDNGSMNYATPEENDNATSILRFGKLLPYVYRKYTYGNGST